MRAALTSPDAHDRRRTAHGLAAACAAGMALATAGTWVRFALERTARIDTHTTAFVIASAISGTGLVVTGIASLALARRADALSWRALAAWAAAAHAAALPSLPLTSSDVFASLAFGALHRAGLSPYRHAPPELAGSPLVALVAPRWVNDPSPYGPLFHPVVALASGVGARLGQPLWGALFAYKLLLLVALAVAFAVAARHLRRACAYGGRETWTWLALGPLVAWEVTAQGHNDGLLFLALVVFVTAASFRPRREGAAPESTGERDALAVIGVAAGVAVKYALAPFLALFLLVRARQRPWRACGLALLAIAVIAAAFLPEWRSATLRSVLPMVGGESARHAHSFTDLVCLVLDGAGQPAASALAYRVLSACSALACAAALAYTAWRAHTVEELAHGLLLFLVTLYVTAPWFQPWYVCWALPLLLVEADPRWRRLVAVFAVITVAQWIAPLDPVTTVLGDAWLVWRACRLRAPSHEPAAAGP